MRMKILAAAAAVLLAATTPAGASQAAATTPAATSPKATALARRYIAAVHLDAMMGSMMSSLAPTMLDATAKRLGGQVPDDMRKAFTDAATESSQAMVPIMVERMTPVIASSFTEDELQAAATYYESPLGQSLLAKTPAFMARMQPAMAELIPAMQADLQSRICKKIDCSAALKP